MLCAAQKSDQTEECVGVAVRVLERTQHVVREASGPHDASPTETRVVGMVYLENIHHLPPGLLILGDSEDMKYVLHV